MFKLENLNAYLIDEMAALQKIRSDYIVRILAID